MVLFGPVPTASSRGGRRQTWASTAAFGPESPRADASLATCAMAPAGSKRAAEAAPVEAPTAAPETSSTASASSNVAPAPVVVATPKGETLVQKALEESTQQRRASNHRRTVDQVINKVIYDNFRSWNALQTDGVRVGGLTLRERLLDDRKKVGISGGLRGVTIGIGRRLGGFCP